MEWRTVNRPGYFGRRRDEIIAGYNREHGEGDWRLAWIADCSWPPATPGPGNIPFPDPSWITQPSKVPWWAGAGSVEDF
jgi:hypothetical protein